jgi:hypothetical protein
LRVKPDSPETGVSPRNGRLNRIRDIPRHVESLVSYRKLERLLIHRVAVPAHLSVHGETSVAPNVDTDNHDDRIRLTRAGQIASRGSRTLHTRELISYNGTKLPFDRRYREVRRAALALGHHRTISGEYQVHARLYSGLCVHSIRCPQSGDHEQDGEKRSDRQAADGVHHSAM